MKLNERLSKSVLNYIQNGPNSVEPEEPEEPEEPPLDTPQTTHLLT